MDTVIKKNMNNDFSRFETEMNRGFLQVLVLAALNEPLYGYLMISRFEDLGYEVEESSLYPLLRRLEQHGLIRGEWQLTGSRPKKYYRITEEGRAIRSRLMAVWRKQNHILDTLMEGEHDS